MIALWKPKQKKFSRGAALTVSTGAHFSVKVQGYLLLQAINGKGIVGFGVWFYFTLTGIGLERFPRAYSLYNPFGIK